MHLAHPTTLTSPRTQSLTKGVQLTAKGFGGYTATGAFGLLRPAMGYTLTVSRLTDIGDGTPDVCGQYAGSDGMLWGGNFAIASGAGDLKALIPTT